MTAFLRTGLQRRSLIDRLASDKAPRETVDWRHADAFLKGDFSAVPKSIRAKIESWARQPAVAEIAARYACDAFGPRLLREEGTRDASQRAPIGRACPRSLPMNGYIEIVVGLEPV